MIIGNENVTRTSRSNHVANVLINVPTKDPLAVETKSSFVLVDRTLE